jgi:Fibronectin type III domain
MCGTILLSCLYVNLKFVRRFPYIYMCLLSAYFSRHCMEKYNVILFPDKPGKPGTPIVKDVQKNSVDLAWSAPTDDGGASITGYVVEYCEETAFFWLPANEGELVPGLRCTVRGLAENTAYKFRVAARNKAGDGPASECILPVQVREPIGKSLIGIIVLEKMKRINVTDKQTCRSRNSLIKSAFI